MGKTRNGAWCALVINGALLAAPVAAQDALTLSCAFDVECIAPEGCRDTTFEAQLTVDPGVTEGAPDATLTSVSESIEMTLYANVFGDVTGSAATFAGKGDGAFHTIAREPDGTAVYTVTMDSGPLVVTYLGRCEVGE